MANFYLITLFLKQLFSLAELEKSFTMKPSTTASPLLPLLQTQHMQTPTPAILQRYHYCQYEETQNKENILHFPFTSHSRECKLPEKHCLYQYASQNYFKLKAKASKYL